MFQPDKAPGESFTTCRESGLSLDDASKLLLKAADEIERRGWCQGAAERDGRLCLMGGMRVAAHGDPSISLNELMPPPGLSDAVRRLRLACGGDVATWNDSKCKSQQQAVAKLRAVALGG